MTDNTCRADGLQASDSGPNPSDRVHISVTRRIAAGHSMSDDGWAGRTTGAVTIPVSSAKFAEFDGRGERMACSRLFVDVRGTYINALGATCRLP